MDFTAIDFETANSSSASACSVGLVKVRDGRVVDRVGWLIRPPSGHDVFSPRNTRIHGIVESDVAGARSWTEQFDDLVSYADGDVMVAHNAGFDMGVIRGACRATGATVPRLRYLCSLVVARATHRLPSYRLTSAASAAGYGSFAHHDALADAEACAAIVVHSARQHAATDVASLAAATHVPVRTLGGAASVVLSRRARVPIPVAPAVVATPGPSAAKWRMEPLFDCEPA